MKANTTTVPPRLQIISTQSISEYWADCKLEDKEVTATIAWYREAQQLHPGYYKEIGNPASLPHSIITGLYPEVAAFGPNGLQVIQMLQALTDINHYVSTNPKESRDIQKACNKLFDATTVKNLPDMDWTNFFQDEEYILWRIISMTLMEQRDYSTDIKAISKSQKQYHPLIIYLGAAFAAQINGQYDNPHLPALTEPLRKPWAELTKEVTKAGIHTYMPELKPAGAGVIDETDLTGIRLDS